VAAEDHNPICEQNGFFNIVGNQEDALGGHFLFRPQLDELAAYTVAWLPAPFMARPVAEAALDRLAAALAPNGHLVAGLFAVPIYKAGAAFTALQIVRSGGHVWEIADLEQQIVARGFVDVESCLIPPTCFVIGRRP